jgi:hypothetical protein
MTDLDSQAGAEPDAGRPWERPGAVRRDCAPHRGNLLGALGNVSLALGILAAVFVVPLAAGLPLGVLTASLAERDLTRMASGAMDPAGREETELGRLRARQGLALCVISPFTAVALWAVLVTVVGLVLSLG